MTLAYVLAVVLLVGSIGIAFLANWQTAVVIAIYLVIQLGYCFGLKNQPVIDICIVSSGFLLRAAALRWGWTLPGFPTHARRV